MRRLVVIAILAYADVVAAYPISPVPLWELLREADLVVYGEVGAQEHVESDGPFSGDASTIAVVETWKGDAQDAVTVHYRAGIVCPAPPRYVEGERVLAFLRRHEGEWRTVGLSYGSLYPTAGQIGVYRNLVDDALRLQDTGDAPDPDAVRRWHVAAAAQRATRWHGLYVLNPAGDRLHSFYDQGERDLVDASFTADELRELAAGFVAEPSLDGTLPMMLQLLAAYEDPELDAKAVGAVDALMYRPNLPHWTRDAMRAVAERLGPGIELEAAEQPSGLGSDPLLSGLESASDEELRRAWKAWRDRVDIPEQHIRTPPAGRVSGVGASTPP